MRLKALLPTLLAGIALLVAVPIVAQPTAGAIVYFYVDGQAAPVPRRSISAAEPRDAAVMLLEALLAGPTSDERASGYLSALPPGTELAGLVVEGPAVTVNLLVPESYLYNELDAYLSDAIVDQVVKTLHPLDLHHVQIRARDSQGNFVPLSDFLPRPVVPAPTVIANDDVPPDSGGPAPEHVGQPPALGQGQPQGAMAGKTVWLSAGHGWYWSSTLSRWNSQRPNTYGIVEDFANAEAVNYYLARYLWNAGADVWLVRERSMNTNEVIVDNDTGAPGYVETGSWYTSGSPGYGGGSYRYAIAANAQSSTATWTPNLPEAGSYAVWVWYLQSSNRATDARYDIQHAGGVTTVRLSQEVHGQTWRYLGEYYFEAGTAGRVTLGNESGDAGQAIAADAVRFGGGLGTFVAPGGTSGEPRWEEQAYYYARYQGMPASALDNDVVARPIYAEWETAKGYPEEVDNAVYVSWHTNAGGGTGTDSYIHSSGLPTGSAALQDWVHAELVSDLKAGWDSGWTNRGQKSANFGELRELTNIPGLLLEVAFHDTEDPGDADDLKQPVFRQIAARGVYQGIAKYFADRDGTAVRLSPEPPSRLVARSSGPGQATVSWTAPPCCNGLVGDAASSYKVYHSTNGRGFDDGTQTNNTSLVVGGLQPGTLHFFRVTALNEGGESFATPVVAMRTPAVGNSPSMLIVDGFERLDDSALIPQWESPALGTARRMFLERMNRYDFAVEHGRSLDNCGVAFDGATNEAVAAGDVSLADYGAVDWFVGEDSVADESLSAQERTALAAYLDGGGGLLISGSEIGYDLVGNGRDPAFHSGYLRASYVADDAGTYLFTGTGGGPFAGLSGSFDDSTHGTYDVGYPDRLGATNGSSAVLSYSGGAGGTAAVAYDGAYRIIYFGFPLETVVEPATRDALFCTAATFLPPPVAGVDLQPNRDGIAEPGQTAVYTHTLTNSGDQSDTFDLSHHSSQGWTVEHPAALTLGSGQATTVFVSVTVPAEAVSGTVDTTQITATSQADPATSDSVVETTTIRDAPPPPAAGVELAPDRAASVQPGQVAVYAHTLTNSGGQTDTFDLSHSSSQGWTVEHPAALTLNSGQATTVFVSVTVPVEAVSGTVDTTQVTATSQADPATSDSVVEITTVWEELPPPTAGVELVPDRAASAEPGRMAVYTHTLTNSGEQTDTFDLSHSSSQGWTVQHPAALTLDSDQATIVIVSVMVPAEAVSGTVDTTQITATSQADPATSDSAADTTTVWQEPAPPLIGVELSPSRAGYAEPDQVVVYTHTLSNSGEQTDSYQISHRSSQGWTVNHPFSLTLASGEAAFLSVSLAVPLNVVSGTVDTTVLTATSLADSLVSATVSDTTTISQTVSAAQTPRIINPGFEGGQGQSAWQASPSGGVSPFAQRVDLPDSIEPHSGNWLAWLGPRGAAIDSAVATQAMTQVVALPSGEPTATLSLAWVAQATSGHAQVTDNLTAAIYDLSGTLQMELLNHSGPPLTDAWQTAEFDLSAWAGQSVQIALRSKSAGTGFFVDDVQLATWGPHGARELRALWVDAYHDGIKTRQQIDELIETARAGNFNALVVQVVRRGDAYYPSAFLPWAPDARVGFDALDTLITRAHAAGLEVHAWATTLAIWSYHQPPSSPDHAFNLHGPGATGRDYWLMTSFNGEDRPGNEVYYLDPGHPDVADYVVDVYRELAENYDLDGLHLDRVRYPEPQGEYCRSQVWYCQDWGYNPVSMSRFQAHTGRSDLPEPLDEEWLQWRREQVTNLVRRIYLTVTSIKPKLRLSAAVSALGFAPTEAFGWQTRAPYRQQLQDWQGWLREGSLDLALPMIYRDQDSHAHEFDAWSNWAKDQQVRRGIAIGTGLYLNAIEDSTAQWLGVRQPSAQGNRALGMSGFSYASPSDEGTPRRSFVNLAVTDVFSQPALVPPIPWKDDPTLGHLMGTLSATRPCLPVTDGYTLTLSGPEGRTLAADGNGWFGAIDLLSGSYLLASQVLAEGCSFSCPVRVAVGTVTDLGLFAPPCSVKVYLPVILR